MNTTEKIVEKARFLYHAAPQPFDDFLIAFTDYASQQTINLVNTTVNIQLAQGHAQQCQKFLNVLMEAKKNG